MAYPKKLKAVALSDLHLGVPESLLYSIGQEREVNALECTVQKIAELAKADSDSGLDSGVEELILIGDIVDLSESEDEAAYTNTRIFLDAVVKAVAVEKIVYIPGNHDHHLWVDLLRAANGGIPYWACSPKVSLTPLPVVDPFRNACLPRDVYDSPIDIPVEVYYPNYRIDTVHTCFLFDHGHLFSNTIEQLTDAEEAFSLEEVEERSWQLMERIWYETKGSLRERVYGWIRNIGLSLEHSARGTTFQEDSTPVLDEGSRPRILRYLETVCYPLGDMEHDFHFIFGHTHHGGRLLRADRKFRVHRHFITIWNTGGWIVPSKIFSPDAYIFFIERDGDTLRPEMYKLVARRYPTDEGDYDRKILVERAWRGNVHV